MDSHRIVLCNGCFDPLHYGHILHFRAAREFGNWLVVSVTMNGYVGKGPGRPVFDEIERADMIRELRCVNEVVLVESSLDALKKVRPHVFVKGGEYIEHMDNADLDHCEWAGIQVAFTTTKCYSSTNLLHHYDRLR